tara:strand:- start:121 stop:321 length:201 start_codon:yes stop_codon:yes gene_type:complete
MAGKKYYTTPNAQQQSNKQVIGSLNNYIQALDNVSEESYKHQNTSGVVSKVPKLKVSRVQLPGINQ